MTQRINQASTVPIPSSLTLEQVWAGLLIKCAEPMQFIPEIVGCDVLSRDSNGMKRRITFDHGVSMMEDITYFAPYKVNFILEDGSEVTNVISHDSATDQRYLTFTFSFVAKKQLSPEELLKEQNERGTRGARAVTGTIKRIEALAQEGKI